MSDFEDSLAKLDERLQEIQRHGKAVVSAIARARSAAKLGRAGEIPKTLEDIGKRIGEAEIAASDLSEHWSFDTAGYLTDGRFVDDLKGAAAEKGLALFDRDGRIYCFPLLLRVEPRESAVRIGRKLERRIRPSELVRLLAAVQKRPQRFREERFLELLYNAWRRLAGSGWRGTGAGPAIGLSEIHETLTLLPGSDYPAEEFARDLLLLDRRPDLRTRDGSRFEFPGSTLSKGRMRRLAAYDEQGRERAYVAVRFVKEG